MFYWPENFFFNSMLHLPWGLDLQHCTHGNPTTYHDSKLVLLGCYSFLQHFFLLCLVFLCFIAWLCVAFSLALLPFITLKNYTTIINFYFFKLFKHLVFLVCNPTSKLGHWDRKSVCYFFHPVLLISGGFEVPIWGTLDFYYVYFIATSFLIPRLKSSICELKWNNNDADMKCLKIFTLLKVMCLILNLECRFLPSPGFYSFLLI